MQVIKIKVTQTDVTITEKPEKITAENYNQIKCIFDLDEAFDDLIVRASFNGEYATVENGECFAPVLKQGNCSLGVYGYAVVEEKLERRISPSPKMFYVNEGSYNENDAQSDNPTPTELEEHYNRVKELVDSGKLKGDPGEKGDKGDKGDTGATGATGPQGPPGKDAVTDTELSTDSDNAIANSTVSKVLAYGNLIGFEKISSYEEFEEFNAKYPVGVSEDDFLVLYITSDLSYSDINGSFDCPPGLYVITADNFFRLCPDAESVNSHFKNIEEMMSYWYALAASKANQTELDALKTNLDDVSDTADEALTVARGRNRALCFFTKQELDSWLNGEFQREDGKTKADLQVGDNLYIVEVGVPDYWWDGEQVRPLETQKVDLSEYAEKEYVDEKVEQEVSVPNSEIVNYLEVADILGIWKNATAGRTSFANLFENSNVKTIPLIDTSSGTTFTRMFKNCAKLENIPFLDMSKAINMFNMFNDCTSLTSFRGYDTSKVTNFNGTFMNCSAIEVIEIDTSSATAVSYLFSGCSALTSVKTLDFSKVTQQDNVFRSCANLVHIEFVPESIKLSISLLACPFWGNAKNWWTDRKNSSWLKKNFDFVTPKYKNGEMKKGDIGIRTSGTYGHIFVVYGPAANGKFKYYDQNATGNGDKMTLREKTFSSSYINGILRPKNQSNLKSATLPSYTVGKTYTITGVRGVYADKYAKTRKKVKQLTANGKQNTTSKNANNNAYFKKGTRVTVLEVFKNTSAKKVMIRCPSGWITAYNANTNWMK